MNIPTFLLVFVIAIHVVGLVFIIKWIYDDAQSRKMNPWGWILLTALLSPNFIGLIAYLLFRRKDSEIACNNCGHSILHQMNYCYWCGKENDNRDKNLPRKPSNISLIIGVTIMLASTTTLFTMIFIMYR